MKLSEKQEALFEFVKLKHGNQKRKYTDAPYYTHLLNVAEIVSEHEKDCVEIALCHDLFEDTNCDFDELYKALLSIGYGRDFSYDICRHVQELTDKYTKESYPYLNRAKRKQSECERLSKISYTAQTVKYADLIDNGSSIVKHDEDFAKIYLKEKEDILKTMTNGNQALFNLCQSVLMEAQDKVCNLPAQ